MGMPPFQVIFAVGREGLRPPLPRVCPAEFAKLITGKLILFIGCYDYLYFNRMLG